MDYRELFAITTLVGIDGYVISNYLRKDDPGITELEIPRKIMGDRVIMVSRGAFMHSKYLRSVRAFCDCGFGTEIFRGCTSLVSVELPWEMDSVTPHMFEDCVSLKKVKLHSEVWDICEEAFAGCVSLEEIFLPQVMEIHYHAFNGCSSLRSVGFGRQDVSVAAYAFENCVNLPAETAMLTLVSGSDITEPFSGYQPFDWNTALRRDVFELAMKYGSFADINKADVLCNILARGLFEDFFPMMKINERLYRAETAEGFESLLYEIFVGECENNSEIWKYTNLWMTDKKLFPEIVAVASRRGHTEFAAMLLDYKRKRFGFIGGDDLEL